LGSLDVSNNTALIELKCEKNKLSNIDVSRNTKLIWLYCTDNNLTGLDVSKCTELYGLLCDNNPITSLDVSNNIELEYLDCFGQSYNKVNKTVDVNGKNEFDFSSISSLNADKVLNVSGGTLSGNTLTFTAPAAIITYDCGAGKTLGFMLKAKNYVAPQQPVAKKGPTNIKAKTYWRKSVVTWKNTSNKKTISKVYVQYSKTENFTKGVKTKKLAPGKKKVILKKLKRNTGYYIHICYKYKDGSKSEWSKVKKIKTRK
ncbi:MAG: hypothetical protein HUJ79_07225, partial [Firmicutes bacterium]|nr:hypothetical protein [Bacillota bacterium]